MQMKTKQSIKTISEHYGYEAQSNQLVEECAELIQAVNKYRRAQGAGQRTTVTVEMALENLVEEMADVEICLEQIKHLLSCHDSVEKIKERKINRQLERINIETEVKTNE